MLWVLWIVACLTGVSEAQSLTGKLVQDHSGVPVASADVKVYKTGQRWLAADLETDGEGRFQATGLVPGDYRLEISKSGYLNATLPFHLAAGETVRPVLRLVRCGVISGRVMDAAGRAVRPSSVAAMTRGPGGVLRASYVRGASATVDDAGRYRLFDLAPDEYVVVASYGASVRAVASTGKLPPLGSAGSGALTYPNNARPEVFTIAGGEEFKNVDFTVHPGKCST